MVKGNNYLSIPNIGKRNSCKWKSIMFCFVCLFLTEEAYSHGGLQTRKLGQTPLSVDQPRSEHLVQIVLEQTLRLVEIFFV